MAVVNEKKKIQEPVVLQAPGTKAVQTAQKVQPASAGKIVDGKQQGYKKVNPYAGLTGVSANTAQQIAQAQQGYQSPYSGMLNGILQQITNPQEFKYEFNQDNLWKAYEDMYTQQGRQASLDAQGQAAGLTGGYGNSYGAAVGNQAYQQWLTKLYDKGLELYDRAYQRHQGDWNQLLQQYDVLNGQDQQGYQQWLNNLNYWTGLGQTENQGYMNDQQMAIERERWEAEQAAAAAAAAEAASRGRGGNGGGKETVYGYNGEFYKKDENGNLVKATDAEAKKNGVNMMLQNMYNSVGGAAGKTGTVNATVSRVTDPEEIKRLYGIK